MTSGTVDSGMDRRRFIKISGAAAITATAAGAAAALLRGSGGSSSGGTSGDSLTDPVIASHEYTGEVLELTGRLASVEAENVRLKSELQLVKNQLESRVPSTTEKQLSENLHLQLESTTRQVGLLSGLLLLYEQMEALNLDDVVVEGINNVDGAMRDLVEAVPVVAEGILTGQLALDELEDEIPLIEEGHRWLTTQMNHLESYYQSIERSLETAVDSSGPLLHKLNDWFHSVLKWLPFGIGERAAQVMDSLAELVGEIPGTTSHADSKILSPLGSLLGGEGDETGIRHRVIEPVRKQALTPSLQLVDETDHLNTRFRDDLLNPVSEKVERKRALRASIKQYRETYKV